MSRTVEKAPDFVSDDGQHHGETWLIPFNLGKPNELDVICAPASGLTAFLRAEGGERIGAIAMAVGATGLYAPMTASQLRNCAAGLMSVADQLDGGSGKQ